MEFTPKIKESPSTFENFNGFVVRVLIPPHAISSLVSVVSRSAENSKNRLSPLLTNLPVHCTILIYAHGAARLEAVLVFYYRKLTQTNEYMERIIIL